MEDQHSSAWWQIGGVGPRHEPKRDDLDSENPTFHPTDQTDITGPIRHHRTNPTPPDQSDHLLPPHNPSVVGSIPTGPSLQTITQFKMEVRKSIFEILRGASNW
jgi:hypothetical protein